MTHLRVAIRCDGGPEQGAGHVGRCIPIAIALEDRGCRVAFVGAYAGVAAHLLTAANARTERPAAGPCGLDARGWSGAVVDVYAPGRESEFCDLARMLPVATVGESTRCVGAGTWIDYHLGSPTETSRRRLGGPMYAPIDPRFVAARRSRPQLARILVATGGSTLFGDLPTQIVDRVADAFPEAEVLAPEAILDGSSRRITALRQPLDLAALAPSLDAAVVGAGVTTYELACAGVPLVAIGLIENQRVVIEGCRATGIAIPVDGIDHDLLDELGEALKQLGDPATRRVLAAAATRTLDGRGASLIASRLIDLWSSVDGRGAPSR